MESWEAENVLDALSRLPNPQPVPDDDVVDASLSATVDEGDAAGGEAGEADEASARAHVEYRAAQALQEWRV